MSKKICLNSNLIYFVVVALFVVIRICSNFGVFDFMGPYGSFIMSFVTQIGLIFLLPVLLFKLLNKFKFKETFKFFSYKKVSWKTILVSVLLGVVVFCLNIYISTFFNTIIQLFGYHPSHSSSSSLPATWWVLILNLISTALLPAICEETLHRGMLLKGNSSFGMKKSILISGLLFGLLHLNIEQFFYATIIGFFLGYLCWCCNSIYPCMIVHFMNNGISVFLSFASSKGWAIGNVFKAISQFLLQSPMIGFVIFILLLCLLIMILLELTNFLIKDTFRYNFGKRQKELTSMAIREAFFKQVEEIKNNNIPSEPIYQTGKKVIYIDFKDFLEFIDKNMDNLRKEEEKEVAVSHVDLKIKILLYGSIVLSAVITVMTFIWGLFR